MDQDIHDHYNSKIEFDRLKTGPSQLEFFRTCEIIHRYIPTPPATVYDIAGGPGVYSDWLARLGYHVHLVDAVSAHIEEALALSKRNQFTIVSATVGDARKLTYKDESADAVLFLGPLYHLTEREDRITALCEVYRVLRTGGVLFAAAISRWASLLDGVFRNLVSDPEFRLILKQDLEDGQHRNPTERLDYFTTAYFHRIEDLEHEISSAGFKVEETFGLEGPSWLLPDFNQRWENPEARQHLIDAARAVEAEPSIRSISAHLLTVATKE